MPLTRAFKAGELSRIGEIADPTRDPRRRPAVRLEEMLDLTLDIESPNRLVGSEAQGFEWNDDFGDPRIRRARHGRVPDAVPIAAQSLSVVGDLPVRARPCRVDLKEETVPMIEERVEHDRDPIIDVEVRVTTWAATLSQVL